jgi:putative molybdenum carrier protein
MVEKIISGGQTGADRAALDFAIAWGIPHGGWCPKGHKAEDGTIDGRYQLKATPEADPAQRTEWNVKDAGGTVVFTIAPELSGGSKQTLEFASQHRKSCLHLSLAGDGVGAAAKLCLFLSDERIKILNVAGSRASEEPAIGEFVRNVLAAITQPHFP